MTVTSIFTAISLRITPSIESTILCITTTWRLRRQEKRPTWSISRPISAATTMTGSTGQNRNGGWTPVVGNDAATCPVTAKKWPVKPATVAWKHNTAHPQEVTNRTGPTEFLSIPESSWIMKTYWRRYWTSAWFCEICNQTENSAESPFLNRRAT